MLGGSASWQHFAFSVVRDMKNQYDREQRASVTSDNRSDSLPLSLDESLGRGVDHLIEVRRVLHEGSWLLQFGFSSRGYC